LLNDEAWKRGAAASYVGKAYKSDCRQVEAGTAEARCSPHEIQAITGYEILLEIERYTRAEDQTILAELAQAKLLAHPRFKHEE
jgi:hypothetical protein